MLIVYESPVGIRQTSCRIRFNVQKLYNYIGIQTPTIVNQYINMYMI
jgi:hypothetical protein